MAEDEKDTLRRYLGYANEALLWKLEGLSERELRWPHTATGTNLLGLVKHVASVEYEYFGVVFGRPAPEPLPWLSPEAEDNADMWATAEESPASVRALFRRAVAHAEATVNGLSLDTEGLVPWWPPERRNPTLRLVLVHTIAEVNRHAGHADIIRELIDGEAGLRSDNDNLPALDEAAWEDHTARLRRIVEDASPGR